jgi:Flp pilus assembly protein TadD
MNINYYKLRLFSILLLGVIVSGCTAIEIETDFAQDISIHAQIINQSEDRFPEIDPLFISDEIKQKVDSYITRFDTELEQVRKLQEILYNEEHLHVQYDDSVTHTAVEAFNARRGNCLGVMNLYIGMARYLGLDANFQTVNVQPNWDKRGDLLVVSQHINATGRFSATRHYVVDFTPEIQLEQLTSAVVSDQDGRALYFNNLGVEALIAGDLEGSLVFFKNALFLDPDLAIGWNNIGTVYNRLGNTVFAEYSYKMAFSSDDRSATAINNLAKFYLKQGDTRTALQYQRAIERFNNRNPYYHFAQGSLAYAEADLLAARASFRRALRLKKEEPDFYLSLAQVYIGMGDIEEAEKLHASAEELVLLNAEIYRPSTNKMRLINKDSILRDYMPGISIQF